MPQPRFLARTVARFSEGKQYVITNIKDNTKFLLVCDIQPFNFLRYGRTDVNFDVYNSISIYVVYNHQNPILQGNNTHALDFNGKRYIVKEKMECDRVGFMRYIAEAYTDPQIPIDNSIQDV